MGILVNRAYCNELMCMYTFCLLRSYLINVVALLIFICCYQHVLVNKDIHNYHLTSRSNVCTCYLCLAQVFYMGVAIYAPSVALEAGK